MPRDAETLAQIALSVDEYDQIVGLLDREPNDTELGMFGAMWSEHCGYKNSKPLLRLFQALLQKRQRKGRPSMPLPDPQGAFD